MQLTCRFPVEVTGKALVDEAFEALEAGLAPLEVPLVGLKPVSVYLSIEKMGRLAQAVGNYGKSEKELIEQMAYAMRDARRRGRVQADVTGRTEDDRHRAALREPMIAGVDAGKIVLAEGGTGVGKSRILGKVAEHILEAKKSNVVWVAAPTITVMMHLMEEFRRVNTGFEPAVLLGRQQFVSARRLCALLDEMTLEGKDMSEASDKVVAWLNAGGPPCSEHTRRMARLVPGISFLHEDLAVIAPDLADVRCGLLEKDLDEPAEAVRAELAERAARSRIVFCTHMMLVLTSIRTPKEEPLPFSHVLVDEAHEIEACAAKTVSAEVSLHALRSWFKRAKLTHTPEAVECINKLMIGLRENDSLRSHAILPAEIGAAVHRELSKIDRILAAARKIGDNEREEIREEIAKVLRGGSAWTRIVFSPTRRYPSLHFGPSNVSFTLSGIWGRCNGAVLASATIFLPDFSGGISSGYMKAKLGIPEARVRPVGPVTPRWISGTPTLLVPGETDAAILCYPGADEIDEENTEGVSSPTDGRYGDWAHACAQSILGAAGTAQGGMLVLCNSFRDIKELSIRLAAPLEKRLIAHKPNWSTQAQKEAFVEARRRGIKPVWLAAGAAWTGLDLSDAEVAPEKDRLLTDLVIVRMPFGLNRTSTQEGRRRSLGRFRAELWEAAIRFRQGIGRLVRRNGVRDRRIWILDGRLWSPMHRHIHPLRTILAGYLKRECFSTR